jgi:hypothetical protein
MGNITVSDAETVDQVNTVVELQVLLRALGPVAGIGG